MQGGLIGSIEEKVETFLIDNALVAGKLKDLVMTSLGAEIEKKAAEKIDALTAGLKNEVPETLLHEVQAALRESVPAEIAKEGRRQKVGPFVECLLQYHASPNDDLFQRLMAVLRDDQGAKGMRQRIRSAICSQLTLHPVTNWQNHLKSDIHLTDILEKVFHLSEVDLRPSSDTQAKAIDVGLWNIPVPQGEECKNPLCHRVFAVFGPSYTHAQLNELTHSALGEMFGKVHVKPFEQLSVIMRKERVVDSEGRDTYLLNVENLKNLPITFVVGGRNQLFYPETSALTLEWLRKKNPDSAAKGCYERHVFPNYAHLDLFVGKKAADEVFPFLLEQLQAWR